jgi:hypothetical protein
MSVTPAINRHVFFSMHFSNSIEVILTNTNEIDFENLKNQLEQKNPIIKVCNTVTINLNTMLLYVKGYKLSNTKWITLQETQENNMIELDCTKKDVYDCVYYLYHMYENKCLIF